MPSNAERIQHWEATSLRLICVAELQRRLCSDEATRALEFTTGDFMQPGDALMRNAAPERGTRDPVPYLFSILFRSNYLSLA
jgi:hypothetical protein